MMNQIPAQHKTIIISTFAVLFLFVLLWQVSLISHFLSELFSSSSLPLIMAPFSGQTFWMTLVLFVIAHQVGKLIGIGNFIRNALMITFSLFVIGLAQANHFWLLPFVVFLTAAIYGTGKTVLHISDVEKEQRRLILTFIIVCLVVCILCYFKYSQFQWLINCSWQSIGGAFTQISDGTNSHIFLLGVSYFSFKFIHFLVDCYNKKIVNLNLFTFINYILFFPSFFSGPINRYNTFAENIHNNNETESFSRNVSGIKRIINGLFKKIVLANNLLPLSIASLDFSDPSVTPLQAISGIYAYMFYIYFDFSGYTDMAIGSAKLVGINLPENFNYPFLKRNIQQFWANWHMSLTNWLTDYIYWPLARKLRRFKRLKKMPVTNSNICIIITFMVCGLWHGDGITFFLWGTYHGIGLALLNVYKQIVKKYYSQRWRKFVGSSRIAYGISTFITFNFVAFGFLIFHCDFPKLKLFFQLFS